VQDHLLPHHDGGGIVRGSTGNVGLPVNNKLDDDDPNNLALLEAPGSALLLPTEVSDATEILSIVSDVAGIANRNLLVNGTSLPYNGERPATASLSQMPLPSLSQMSLSCTPY
jgi:hypothetical protein